MKQSREKIIFFDVSSSSSHCFPFGWHVISSGTASHVTTRLYLPHCLRNSTARLIWLAFSSRARLIDRQICGTKIDMRLNSSGLWGWHMSAIYLNGVIVTGGDKHLGVAWIERHTIDDIGVLIFGQTDAIISIPNVCMHIFSTTEMKRQSGIGLNNG